MTSFSHVLICCVVLGLFSPRKQMTALRRSQEKHNESVPVRRRADIGRIRDCVTYFSPDWKKGGAAIYLGGITEMVRMARSKRGVRSACVRWQNESQQRAM